jgi:hypothetical protein
MSNTSAKSAWVERVLEVNLAGAAKATPARPAAIDVAAMRRSLADSVGKIGEAAGDSADRRKELTKLAEDANAALKGQDLITAMEATARLQSSIENGPGEEKEAAPEPYLNALSKARVAFVADQRRVVAAIELLRQSIDSMFQEDEDQETQLAKADSMLEALAAELGTNLSGELDAVVNEPDAGRRQGLIEGARETARRLTELLSSHPIIAALDGNEVRPEMTVAAPMIGRLQDVSTALG